MYSLLGYGSMIADHVRMETHLAALRQAVTPGAVVLDIGTGTGIFAMLACRLGARRVYAVEPGDSIHVARQLAAANGYANRITFIQDVSTSVTLPETSDVIISDLRGVLPLFQRHIPSIVDARVRLLAPGGALISQRDTLWAAVVEAPSLYERHAMPGAEHACGLDMRAARQMVTNTWGKHRALPEHVLLEPRPWVTLDYRTIASPDVSGEITWAVERPGTAHGLILWFDALLADGVTMSNAPGAPAAIYGHAFFPWSEPVGLAAGDTVSVTLHADLVGDDYIWRWDTLVSPRDGDGAPRAAFHQSTFFAVPHRFGRFRTRAAEHVPVLSEEGRIDQFILGLMDGGRSLRDIAEHVAERFPASYATSNQALERVRDLSERYSQ